MATIAQVLRERREERRLTLEDVREQLGIPLHYLEAMEGARSPLIADYFYLIPYVRRYAEFLDLNPSLVVGQFLAEAGREEPRPAVKGRPVDQRTWLFAGLAVAAVLLIGWLLFG